MKGGALSKGGDNFSHEPVLNPALEVHNIGKRPHVSVVDNCTKTRALKLLPKIPYRAEAEDRMGSAAPTTAGGMSMMSGGGGDGGSVAPGTAGTMASSKRGG